MEDKHTRYISSDVYSHDDLVKLMKSGNTSIPYSVRRDIKKLLQSKKA